jgi:hypothetical protein
MNDKIIFKYKVIFVIWRSGFHQVVGTGGKDFLFNFCLWLHEDLSFMHSVLSVTNTRMWLCVSVWNWEGTSFRPIWTGASRTSDSAWWSWILQLVTKERRWFRMNGSCCRSGNNKTLFHQRDCLYSCKYTNCTIPVRTTLFLKMNPGVRNMQKTS